VLSTQVETPAFALRENCEIMIDNPKTSRNTPTVS
jgi:hypothetical protein